MVTLWPAGLVEIWAPAKVNLGLEVLGRRPDGYHEVVTILQPLSSLDFIELLPSDRLRYRPLEGERPETDLVARALQAARERLGIELVAEVRLKKHIPVAAGLGGGSSDAGTLLGGLARLAHVPLEEAERAAATLGSDVPFFVRGEPALATGTGTDLQPLPIPADLWFIVIVPDLALPDKTRRLYAALTPSDFSDGTATLAQAERLRAGLPLDVSLLRNAFTRLLLQYEPVRRAEATLRACGAEVVLPSGAGPALFAPFSSREDSEQCLARLSALGQRVIHCDALPFGFTMRFKGGHAGVRTDAPGSR